MRLRCDPAEVSTVYEHLPKPSLDVDQMFIYLQPFFIFVLTLLTRIIKTYIGVLNEQYWYTNGTMSVRQSRKIDMLLFCYGVACLMY